MIPPPSLTRYFQKYLLSAPRCFNYNDLKQNYLNTDNFLEDNALAFYFAPGEMAERSNAAVLKTVDCHRSGGSNPSLSALTSGALAPEDFFWAKKTDPFRDPLQYFKSFS